jgi:hypothetical protein
MTQRQRESALTCREVDQREPEFPSLLAAQMRGCLDQRHFKRRLHSPLEQVTTPCQAVAQTQHDMQVEA